MLSVKQGGIKYYFWVFGMTRPGIEPRSPESLANTLAIKLIEKKMKKWIIWKLDKYKVNLLQKDLLKFGSK